MGMEQLSASKFKATCLAVIRKVRKTRRPVVITHDGEPAVQIIPVTKAKAAPHWLGSMEGTAEVHGDIVGPVSDIADWDAGRD